MSQQPLPNPQFHIGQWIEDTRDPSVYGEIASVDMLSDQHGFICYDYGIKGRERAIKGRSIGEIVAREIDPKPLEAFEEFPQG